MPAKKETGITVNRIVLGTISAMGAIILAGGIGWLNHVNAAVDDLQAKHERETGSIAEIRERTKAVEVRTESMDKKIDEQGQQQQRILDKLDRVLELQKKP